MGPRAWSSSRRPAWKPQARAFPTCSVQGEANASANTLPALDPQIIPIWTAVFPARPGARQTRMTPLPDPREEAYFPFTSQQQESS